MDLPLSHLYFQGANVLVAANSQGTVKVLEIV